MINSVGNYDTRLEIHRHYFVDEGGDSTLFSSKGKVIIDTPGCSRFFILGLLDVSNPEKIGHDFAELRMRLMQDPYYTNVPSMRLNGDKTAVSFHAKDDLPEVRKEVFALLRNMTGLRYFAVVADKWRVLEYARQQKLRNPGYRYHPGSELYKLNKYFDLAFKNQYLKKLKCPG